MSNTAENHYAMLLGPIYTWMVGDIDAALARSALELDEIPLPGKGGGWRAEDSP